MRLSNVLTDMGPDLSSLTSWSVERHLPHGQTRLTAIEIDGMVVEAGRRPDNNASAITIAETELGPLYRSLLEEIRYMQNDLAKRCREVAITEMDCAERLPQIGDARRS